MSFDAHEQLGLYAVLVESKLHGYVALHNKLMKEQTSVWSTIKNTFGFHVNFEQHYSEVQDELVHWNYLAQKSIDLHAALSSTLSESDKEFLDITTQFVGAVRNAVLLLLHKQIILISICQGNTGAGSSFSDLKNADRDYKKAAMEYYRMGARMNSLYKSLFSGPI